MDSGARSDPDSAPLSPALLADLQAGLLDDDTAAQVRRRVRRDPEAAQALAALDSVRSELARLGTDDSSAAEVPAAVTDRVGAALRNAPFPRGYTPPRPLLHRAGLLVGILAGAVAAVLGAVMLGGAPRSATPAGPTARQITATPQFPLSGADVLAVLANPPDLGPLAEARHRASCLIGLGYSPAEAILGGSYVDVAGRPGVLLLLPASTANDVRAVVVAPTCTDSHTGLVTETTVKRR